jgi:hypothetical protein
MNWKEKQATENNTHTHKNTMYTKFSVKCNWVESEGFIEAF